jgi:predicted phage tail protein
MIHSLLVAQESGGSQLLGDDFLEWMLVALGAALVVGNVLALVRPRARTEEGDLQRAPVVRSLVFAGIGMVAAVWGLATLFS